MAKKIGRNESCPCGSGRKYKKCCGNLGKSSKNNSPRITRLIEELDKFFLNTSTVDTFNILSKEYGLYLTVNSVSKLYPYKRPKGFKEIDHELHWNNRYIEVTEEQRIISLFLMVCGIIQGVDDDYFHPKHIREVTNGNLLTPFNNKFSSWLRHGKVKLYRGIRKEWTPESFDICEGESKVFSMIREEGIRYTGSILPGYCFKQDENGKVTDYKFPRTSISESDMKFTYDMTLDEVEKSLSRGELPPLIGNNTRLIENGWLSEAEVDVNNIHYYCYGIGFETIVKGPVHCKVNKVVKGQILNNGLYSKVRHKKVR